MKVRCAQCRKEITDSSGVCKNCGCMVFTYKTLDANDYYVGGTDKKENPALANLSIVLAILFPIIGFIVSIVGFYKYKSQKMINRCSRAALLSLGDRILLIFIFLIYLLFSNF